MRAAGGPRSGECSFPALHENGIAPVEDGLQGAQTRTLLPRMKRHEKRSGPEEMGGVYATSGTTQPNTTPAWRNGRRAGFRNQSLRGCEFDSHSGHARTRGTSCAPNPMVLCPSGRRGSPAKRVDRRGFKSRQHLCSTPCYIRQNRTSTHNHDNPGPGRRERR